MTHQIIRPLASAAVVISLLLSGGVVTAQSNHPFVSDDFAVPDGLETDTFRLRMLTVHDVVKDFEAAMSSVEHLKKVWPGSGWPEGLTIEEDLVALGWHQQEFWNRSSFAYTVVPLDDSKILGTVYIDPTRKRGYDTEVYLWVTKSEFDRGTDAKLFAAVKRWLKDDWPFENPAFPGRSIDWDTWNTIPDDKR